jgi:hypothetical protein
MVRRPPILPGYEFSEDGRSSRKASAAGPAFQIAESDPIPLAHPALENSRYFRMIAWTISIASALQINKLLQIAEASCVA